MIKAVFSGAESELVSEARRLAPEVAAMVDSYAPEMAKEYDDFRRIDLSDWSFFGTVAVVYTVVQFFPSGRGDAGLKSEFESAVAEGLEAWDPAGLPTYENISSFVSDMIPRLDAAVVDEKSRPMLANGMWLVQTLLEKAPESKDERELMRGLGVFSLTLGSFMWNAWR